MYSLKILFKYLESYGQLPWTSFMKYFIQFTVSQKEVKLDISTEMCIWVQVSASTALLSVGYAFWYFVQIHVAVHSYGNWSPVELYLDLSGQSLMCSITNKLYLDIFKVV